MNSGTVKRKTKRTPKRKEPAPEPKESEVEELAILIGGKRYDWSQKQTAQAIINAGYRRVRE